MLEQTQKWTGLLTPSRISVQILAILLASQSVAPPANAQDRRAGTFLAVPNYSLTDIGFLRGFTDSRAFAINIRGEVVGSISNRETGTSHAFLYHRERLFDLGTLLPPTKSSWAIDINARGQIIGQYNEANGPLSAFIYQAGQLRTLAFSNGPFDFTWVASINDFGQVVGNTADYAFLRQPNGTIIQLPGIGGNILIPRAINDLGQVVGEVAGIPNGFQHAILMQAGGFAPHDLGTLGANALPAALNIRGQAVGYSQITDFDPVLDEANGPYYAVLYSRGRVINLGTFGTLPGRTSSFALGINDFGRIVGSSASEANTSIGANSVGFVFIDGKMYDLNSLILPRTSKGLTVIGAAGINNLGQIAGTATDTSGNWHAVILTPRFR